MNEGDHLIWSNYHLDLDDWREDLLVDNPEASESELYQMMHETNDSYRSEEHSLNSSHIATSRMPSSA